MSAVPNIKDKRKNVIARVTILATFYPILIVGCWLSVYINQIIASSLMNFYFLDFIFY